MVFIIFLLLAIIFLVEYLNPLPKASGLLKNNFAAGIAVHNGMGLVSRAAAALMMPILGFNADIGNLEKITFVELIIYFSLFPIIFSISYFVRYYINEYITLSVDSVIRTGKIKFFNFYKSNIRIYTTKSIKQFRKINFLILIIYIPFYLSWPVAILLMSLFPEYRTTLLASTTVATSLNTLIVVLYIDPFISFLSSKKNLTCCFLRNQLNVKLQAVIISYIIFVFIVLIIFFMC